MIQEFLTAWINWYYGENEPYPIELQNKLTYDQKMEVIRKTQQIKNILGR